ncbi:hypothetical protein MIDIC_40001 [Alphaproteobacteria bacterium]
MTFSLRKIIITCLWLLLFWTTSVSLYLVWPDLRYSMAAVPKFQWIGNRIGRPTTIGRSFDYVLCGSSMIWLGLNARTLDLAFSGGQNRSISAASYLVGRDVDCLIARDFVSRHRVSTLVINGYREELDISHSHFSYLALPWDILRHRYACALLSLPRGIYGVTIRGQWIS